MSRTTSLIRRRLLPLLASLPVLGCDADVSGTYALVSIDGEELPFSFELFGTVTITSGALSLSDSTYEFTMAFAEGHPGMDSGTFTLGESNIIYFTSDAPGAPPPPPPPLRPGDTVSSLTPPVDAGAARTESEGSSPVEGRWDGDQITIYDDESTFVFRR
jgi:hypothetical protein